MSRAIWLILLAFAAGAAPVLGGLDEVAEAARPRAVKGTALLVRTEQHLKVALKTSRDMLAGEGLRARAAEVVVCGPTVDLLRRDAVGTEVDAALRQALDAGVDVLACGLSLDRRGISPDGLRDGIRVVPNGLVELLLRDDQGWATVEL